MGCAAFSGVFSQFDLIFRTSHSKWTKPALAAGMVKMSSAVGVALAGFPLR